MTMFMKKVIARFVFHLLFVFSVLILMFYFACILLERSELLFAAYFMVLAAIILLSWIFARNEVRNK